MQQLDAALAFAPLHTPVALSVIRFARKHFPALPQIACFDTTFHIDLPDIAACASNTHANCNPRVFNATDFTAFPANRSCVSLATILPRRLIIAHLGNGASVTAVKER